MRLPVPPPRRFSPGLQESGKRGSNPRPPPWQGGALPLSYFRTMPAKGLEPPRRKALDPKSSASANSATPAYTYEPYWARTSDPLIKSQMLYQLS